MEIGKKDDFWTISKKFRNDIGIFFENAKDLNICEIGSYKGHTTNYLSNIFKKVYPVDINYKNHIISKNFNKNKKNIEYIHLNLYKDDWKEIPDDVDVVLIDAHHDYKFCKMDVLNSLKRFKKLKYIIFDDYAIYEGVKKTVNEFIDSKIIYPVKNVGLDSNELSKIKTLNDIAKSQNLILDSSEGIICKLINKPDNIITTPLDLLHINLFTCNNCGTIFKKIYHYNNHKKNCNLDNIKKIIHDLNNN